ncbi:MAG: hypothetical protein CMJ85_02580 [Planctomycetes bacterium]|jgi:chromosome partitioning protein|nr:hypothetical protein [Planctomycetota bacterium]MDP6424409.1 ParA family protein [Planctomycetota bacterium]
MRAVAIINQKGGVGKTTTVANLGACLARLGQRVLLIDLDSQSNLTLHLAGEEGPLPGPTSFDLLVDGVDIASAIRELPEEQVHIVQGSADLAGIEQALAQKIGREMLLRDALADVQDRFDIVLIDCPPSLGVLSLNALVAADEVLIPLQTEFFALQGMTQLMEIVDVVRQRLNPKLSVRGLLPCMVDLRTNLAHEVVEELRAHCGHLLLRSRIRKNIKLAEAPSHGTSILRYAPESNGADDYLALAAELRETTVAESVSADTVVADCVPAPQGECATDEASSSASA